MRNTFGRSEHAYRFAQTINACETARCFRVTGRSAGSKPTINSCILRRNCVHPSLKCQHTFRKYTFPRRSNNCTLVITHSISCSITFFNFLSSVSDGINFRISDFAPSNRSLALAMMMMVSMVSVSCLDVGGSVAPKLILLERLMCKILWAK